MSGRCGLVVECGFAHVLWTGARNDTQGAPFGLRLVEYVTRQGYNIVGNDPCCRSVPGECYLLTTYNAIRECRDSACRRLFGVRLNAAGVCSEMTQRVDFCMGDTMSICQSIIATNRLYLTEHHTLRVILSEAAQQCNGERESRQMPRSRTPKGRQQAESRHSCKVIIPTNRVPLTKWARQPHFAKTLYRPKRQKASPKSTRAMQSETTLCHEKAGALGGSSRREWEVWRERDASFKRRPSPSKVFLPPRSFKPSDTSRLRATRANRRRGRRLTRFSRSGRRREHGNASQRSRACRLWRDSRP